jgi:hypothetical protein
VEAVSDQTETKRNANANVLLFKPANGEIQQGNQIMKRVGLDVGSRRSDACRFSEG